MKIANIIGARPQFIKYFPVGKAREEFKKHKASQKIIDILIHTGQHYDYAMSKIFFDELGIKEPEYHLGIGSCSHGMQTGLILQKVEDVLLKEKPDVVIVYGDTNSTLGGTLAAAKLHIPVAHIEAGLRSFNKQMPEEINRVLTDHSSSILFCPTETTVNNLRKEGFCNVINNGKIISDSLQNLFNNHSIRDITSYISHPLVINAGDVMFDVILYAVKIAEQKSGILEQLDMAEKEYYLLTLHRAENTDSVEKLNEIIDFVNRVSSGKRVIFPIHPRTRKAYDSSGKKFSQSIEIIEPLGYFDILTVLKNCKLLMTDSGGMQKEAYWLKVPCITLREETEWTETIESGWNILCKDYRGNHCPKNNNNYYGDGKSAERIITVLAGYGNIVSAG
ncbi:MAG: UDP-N-acetyl glucosamine 2-epimerase [Candidatus Loosdrechtia sp.]|uniref:UDP-N-acetyl glucosamine 2-epimerase n=1 Tax=Candidatus Loosdrechtia sp. TaxID=3101272 RepID=UPI003A615843|nr:MAG: UDP-N-acetyl glucosamine 2-epimerase [Candidatus Jettenia sp. AMX2]